MGKMNVSEGLFLVKEKHLLVYRDKSCIEITLRFNGKRGLLIQIGDDPYGDLEVEVTKTTDGCTECRKPDFRKIYKKGT